MRLSQVLGAMSTALTTSCPQKYAILPVSGKCSYHTKERMWTFDVDHATRNNRRKPCALQAILHTYGLLLFRVTYATSNVHLNSFVKFPPPHEFRSVSYHPLRPQARIRNFRHIHAKLTEIRGNRHTDKTYK